MDKLKDCHTQICAIHCSKIEPFESVALVEKYRQFWKPDVVKVVLLAESHVFTEDVERKILIAELNADTLPNYPIHYVKFVYCLAYGEKDLTKNNAHPPRDGTPQFWKIFYSCVKKPSCNIDFQPVLKKTPFQERLSNKVNLLRQLKSRGIWLVDASIVAVYDDGQKKKEMKKVIETSWKNYTKDVIKEANPSYVICIGKGVSAIVETDLKSIIQNHYCVLAQPNARLSAREHFANFQKYYDVCQQYAPTGS
jgi:hypothetical protein